MANGSNSIKIIKPGTILGKYEIMELIGEGGMGRVYKAKEMGLNRVVAVKVISPKHLEDPSTAQRFKNEAKALAKVSHPNVVSIYTVGEENGINYIALEFVDGMTIKDLVKFHYMEPTEAIPLMRQMLEGVKALHEIALLHRDIKPHNMLIDFTGRVKLIDFGIAKNLGDDADAETTVNMVVGSPAYLSPELCAGAKATVQSDIWAMGITFFEMLTGRPPFQGENNLEIIEKIKNKNLEFPEEVKPWVPREIIKIIRKMCSRRAQDRYTNLTEVIEDFDNYLVDAKHRTFNIDEFKVAPVYNEKQLRSFVSRYGLEEAEIKRFINLASKYQQILDANDDKTVASHGAIDVGFVAAKKAIDKILTSTYQQKNTTNKLLNWIAVAASVAAVCVSVFLYNYITTTAKVVETEVFLDHDDIHKASLYEITKTIQNLGDFGANRLVCTVMVTSDVSGIGWVDDPTEYEMALLDSNNCEVSALGRSPSSTSSSSPSHIAIAQGHHKAIIRRACLMLKMAYFRNPLVRYDKPNLKIAKDKDRYLFSLNQKKKSLHSNLRVTQNKYILNELESKIKAKYVFTQNKDMFLLNSARFNRGSGHFTMDEIEYNYFARIPVVSRALATSSFRKERTLRSTIDFTNCKM